MMGSESSGEARRPRRDKRRERNREALLAAAVEIVNREGMASLTPQLIATRAGLHKPAFYAHWKSLHECLQVLSLRVVQQAIWREDALYHGALLAVPPDQDKLRRALEQTLEAALKSRELYGLVVRCRYEDSELGRAIRETIEGMYARSTDMLWDLALRSGVGAQHLREIAHLAERVVESQLVTISRVVEGREKDLHAEALRQQRQLMAVVGGEMRAMRDARSGTKRATAR